MRLVLAEAQALFDVLPAHRRWPTLSPAYVAADALRDGALVPVFLCAHVDGGWLMHAVHEAVVDEGPHRDWQSAYGYGGPVAHGLSAATLELAWREIDGDARDHRVVAEFVRFHPMEGNEVLYPGDSRRDRAVVCIDLSVPDLLASYSGRARTSIRKAERLGLTTAWESAEDARRRFPDFYRESMREIGATDFYMFGDDYFEALLALPGARVLSVFQGEERLSMGLFLSGPAQMEYHLSGTTPAGRAVGATNLLLHGAADAGQRRGLQRLYLGGGVSAREDDPLLKFKSSFAPPDFGFCIGYRVHDRAAYDRLRVRHAALASKSNRVLFYRG